MLGAAVDWVPVCPEVELGLGTPREPIALVGSPEAPRLLGVQTGVDLTAPMAAWAARRARELAALDLDGVVLKARSPSCGVRGVDVLPALCAPPSPVGVGRFAAALSARLPDVWLDDEAGLADPARRARFLAWVMCRRRWRAVVAAADGAAALDAFHARHAEELPEGAAARLGRLVRAAGALDARPAYEAALFDVLRSD